MLLPLWLATIARLVEGVCFVETTETIPREIVVKLTLVATLNACKVQGLQIVNSESVRYNAATKECYLLGKQATGGIGCAPGYVSHVKMLTGCSKYDPTIGYGEDNCFKNATKNPELLKTESSPICPNTPLNGEPTARTYVVAVILPKGKYAVFDNNSQAQIVWDATNTTNASWVYKYVNGRNTYSEPIYAATCVYYPAGVANECKCGAPLPRESSTMMEPGATAVVESANGACATDYSGKFMQAKSNATVTCGPCIGTTVVCINKMLILTVADPTGSVSGQINSYQLSSGTCYTASACPGCS